MTEDGCKALKKGDVVYYRSTFSDGSNAIIETASGPKEVRLVPFSVVKVCKKVVNGHSLSVHFADLISDADAKAAMDRYTEVQRDKAADARRCSAAVGRIERAGFVARTHYKEMQVVAYISDVASVERLADIIVTGARAVDLMAEVRPACPVSDAPMVTLHLSVEQAERALAALKGVTPELLDEVERLRTIEAQAAAWRSHTEALVAAMKTWGTWEDGVPSAEDCGEVGKVGAAFDAALAALKGGE